MGPSQVTLLAVWDNRYFDTVDQDILFQRFSIFFGLSGNVLDWVTYNFTGPLNHVDSPIHQVPVYIPSDCIAPGLCSRPQSLVYTADLGLEPCADVIVSAARRSILVGGGAPPIPKNRRRRGVCTPHYRHLQWFPPQHQAVSSSSSFSTPTWHVVLQATWLLSTWFDIVPVN